MSKRNYGVAEAWRPVMELLRDPGLLLVSSDADGNPNVMTIGWAQLGIVWGKPIMSVFVRPSRFTYDRVDTTGDFTVNVPPAGMADVVQYCGTVSGRDEDKFVTRDLTVVPAKQVASSVIEECVLHYECSVVHKNDLDPSTLAPGIARSAYPDGDFHRVFFGEVVAVYGVDNLTLHTTRLGL